MAGGTIRGHLQAKYALAFRSIVHHFMLMIDWTQCPAVERIPGKVSGAWLFKDTRVPVKALFENVEGGATVQEFLEWFPGVQRAQVDAVLEYTQRSLEAA
jgi:uncharacterized protein (DUF433 family)